MIKFGTAGWRGIIGEEFTFQNVRIVSQAIANYLWSRGLGGRGVIIGYDTRFLSEKFAYESAKVLAGNKITALLCERDTPTPVLAYEVMRNNLAAAINFTASHNPPEYNGLKYSDEDGAPAMPDVTEAIETEIEKLMNKADVIFYYVDKSFIETFREQHNYLEFLKTKVQISSIAQSRMKIAVDPLFGTAREYVDKFMFDNGCIVHAIHNFRDPYFGGYAPEVSEPNLADLKKLVIEKECQLGIATDADADRFAIINERGEFVSCNIIVALIFDYLSRTNKVSKSVGRSISTTHMLDRIAMHNNMQVIETPVGFKYLAQLLKKNEIEIACEENGGFSIKDHIPEKDGILAGLLTAEIIAQSGESLSTLIEKLHKKYGPLYYAKMDFPLKYKLRNRLQKIIKNPPDKVGGRKVIKVSTIDGIKLYLDGNEWVAIRFSGTEPLARMYLETENIDTLDTLIKASKTLLKLE
ncbi:MAG: hypothetical protein A2Y62_22210 [Candidatus Fischerbacteria bacterium RBG_13_37_8]|uniref:Phosphoglucomutase n=1 Tax=Candidatus Fischerbacteria bacterium RBG_13_37_8 TaxID=1817863 RepID=A0A1F5VKU8_9BACT|nr:MAG: hypothetical protein A2Y62_22210 [Candidatus Fischerbacteria bacterium RBG_13_37_8]